MLCAPCLIAGTTDLDGEIVAVTQISGTLVCKEHALVVSAAPAARRDTVLGAQVYTARQEDFEVLRAQAAENGR